MKLLKAVASQQIDEAGFKDLINKMRGKSAKPEENSTPDTHNTSGSDTDPALKRIASQLSDTGDSIKLAIDIDRAGLVNKYLKKGGDVEAANDTALFPEDKIDAIQDEAKVAKNRHNPKEWPETAADRLMLFSVPKSVVQNFLRLTGTSDEDKQNRRKAFANVIAHKYYQMTLKTREAYKNIDEIEALASKEGVHPMSFDILEQAFNPYVIENHPAGILKAARNEWDSHQAEKSAAPARQKDLEVKQKEDEADRIDRLRRAEKTLAGDQEYKSLELAVLDICLSNLDKDPSEITKILIKHFENVQGISIENVQNSVQELAKKYEKTVPKLGDIALELSKQNKQ